MHTVVLLGKENDDDDDDREAGDCDAYVCLSVCPRADLRNHSPFSTNAKMSAIAEQGFDTPRILKLSH